jgi:hypothetical protein
MQRCRIFPKLFYLCYSPINLNWHKIEVKKTWQYFTLFVTVLFFWRQSSFCLSVEGSSCRGRTFITYVAAISSCFIQTFHFSFLFNSLKHRSFHPINLKNSQRWEVEHKNEATEISAFVLHDMCKKSKQSLRFSVHDIGHQGIREYNEIYGKRIANNVCVYSWRN